jgi:hypothetical protein
MLAANQRVEKITVVAYCLSVRSLVNSKSINMRVAQSGVMPESPADAAPALTEELGTTVRILRTISELEELRTVWTAWGGHPHSDIDFLLMLLQSREEILNPHVIVVYRHGKPDAMLVGRLERSRISLKVGYLPLFSARARIFTFQYGALRGNPSDENCKEIILAILRSLKSGEADMAYLNHPRTDSFLYKRALSVPSLLSRDNLPVPQPHHMMRLPGTIEEVFLGLSSSTRMNLRSKGRKFEKKLDGRLKICCFREVAELEAAISQVEEVARKTYQRGLGVGFDDSPRMRQMLQFYARNGRLRMYVLFAAGTPIAFEIGIVYGGWFYGDHTGYDSHYRDHSPGSYLLTKMIEDLCREGLQGIDFGLGDAPYKQHFGNHSFEEATVYLFAPRMKGLLLKALQTVTSATDNALKNMLARTKLLPKVKRLWRDRLAQKSPSK